ncbi:LuxR C-terminal-related transcriptional regulator [Arabiibacter massiliensis]|uniref:LuxR C-terminal-related transcriptional regulator n=1 Tax=Arabiibacter massiliensis TaxID=1870985 RepID=UPI001E2DCF55|nr:LuxR C-terminal-related transcriptional regulator [Arabiibacter massiliensis]
MPYRTASEEEPRAAQEGADAGRPRDTLILDFLLIVIGFGLCRTWIIFCLGAPLVAGATASLNWMYLAFGAITALAVSFVVNRNGSRSAKARVALFRLTPVALLASGVLIPLAIWLDSEPLIAVGFAAGGVGAGPLQVLWGDRFARHSTVFAALASPAAAIVTALVAGLATDNTSFIGFAIIPLLSFALLLFEANRTGLTWKDLQRMPAADAGAAASPGEEACGDGEKRTAVVGLGVGKLMFSIMTFSFLCRLFDVVPADDDPFAFFGGSAIFSLIVVGVAFLLIVARLRDRFNATLTYRLSLPLMVAGFVAIALFFDTHAAVSLLLINVGYEFFDILTWVLFVDVARRRGEHALHIFGLGVAFMFAGMALGNLAGGVIDSLVASGDVQITVVAMLATLCLVVVAFMVLPEGVVAQLSDSVRTGRKEREAEARLDEPASEAGVGRLERHCACVAEDYGLTPRESEVIVLLAYGRTLSIIARDLQIAKGTARTHIENIYRKLDVHKQQELIDLVESYEA